MVDEKSSGLLSLLLAGTISACGGNVPGHEEDGPRDSSTPSDMYSPDGNGSEGNVDGDSGVSPDGSDAGKDSGLDGSDEGIPDEGVPDEGEENRAPVIQALFNPINDFDYPNPGDIRRGAINIYGVRVIDPEGETVDDGLECRFELDSEEGVYVRDFRDEKDRVNGCSLGRAVNTLGPYSLTVIARDSEGLESDPYTLEGEVVNNVPPVARAGDDLAIAADTSYCFNFGCDDLDASGCSGVPFAPGHDPDGTGSFDPDGTIEEYRIAFDYGNFPLVRQVGACGNSFRYEVGTYTIALIVTDNEDAESIDTIEIEVN